MGSHLYRCATCDRRLMGLDHCDDRHCPTCGKERRDSWRKDMIGWSLDCDYFHLVFTLPHEHNPLIYVNSRNLYKLLMATGKDTMLVSVRVRHIAAVGGAARVFRARARARIELAVEDAPSMKLVSRQLETGCGCVGVSACQASLESVEEFVLSRLLLVLDAFVMDVLGMGCGPAIW